MQHSTGKYMAAARQLMPPVYQQKRTDRATVMLRKMVSPRSTSLYTPSRIRGSM